MKSVIEGKPQYIIYKGRVLQKVLSENRISINELLSEMRSHGVGNINQIEYATIEQNGSLSILKKGEADLAHPIIIDGSIIQKSLNQQSFQQFELIL